VTQCFLEGRLHRIGSVIALTQNHESQAVQPISLSHRRRGPVHIRGAADPGDICCQRVVHSAHQFARGGRVFPYRPRG
jgi:hypothetical protein